MREVAAAARRTPADAERQLTAFVDKFDPKHQRLIRGVRTALRGRLPTERPSDAILSMTVGANGVGLCFLRGATLRDPQKILLGSGNQTRFIRLGG